jgi:hypothetical protein
VTRPSFINSFRLPLPLPSSAATEFPTPRMSASPFTEIQARRLKLKELMPNVELMQKTLGEMNGDADIRLAPGSPSGCG